MKVQKTKVAFFGLLSATLLTISCSKDKVEATPIPSAAATYSNNTGLFITDRSGVFITPVLRTINIPKAGTINDPSKISVDISLNHDNADDLVMILYLPNGDNFTLLRNVGADNNFVANNILTFVSSSTYTISNTASNVNIFAGFYKQCLSTNQNLVLSNDDLMETVLANKSIQGDWILKIYDTKFTNLGFFNFVKINLAEGALK